MLLANREARNLTCRKEQSSVKAHGSTTMEMASEFEHRRLGDPNIVIIGPKTSQL